MEFALAAGWRASGLDFDANAVAFCVDKGLDVQLGGIELFGDESEKFDWITLSHVIEHVHDPISLLIACRRLLRPNGCLWISTPNIDSQGHSRFGADWRGLEPPRHLVIFSHRGLQNALHEIGFDNVHNAPYQPTYRYIALKSRGIAERRDPCAHEHSNRFDLSSLLFDIWGWCFPLDREFITLIARKSPS